MDPAPAIRLVTVTGPDFIDDTRAIFREYAATLAVDLCFQGFEAELQALPGDYVEPHGRLLLALVDGQVAACGAFRPLADVDYANACEMKRLLAQALLDHAREAGHSVMLLDTLDEMETARDLYASLGFEEIPPYYFNPLPGAHYLKCELD